MQTVVTVSKKWDKPEITTTVWNRKENKDGTYVVIRMDMTDFISALKQELNMDAEVDMAVHTIIDGMKYEWTKHPL